MYKPLSKRGKFLLDHRVHGLQLMKKSYLSGERLKLDKQTQGSAKVTLPKES